MFIRSAAWPCALALALGLSAAAALALAQSASREKLQRLNLEETAINSQQAKNLNQLARVLSMLERLSRDPPPALLVSPRDAKDAVRAAILVKAMTPELQARANQFAGAAGEIARQRRLAAVESEALFASDSARADAGPDPGGLMPGELRRLPSPADETAFPPAYLLRPADGPLSQRFGDPVAGGGRANGLTFMAASSTAVRSPGEGQVQYVGAVKGWGVILILRLSGGYRLVLAGLDRASVEVGQSVAAGAPVGWMADGRQSAQELYLEVRGQGGPEDPARWLKINAG